MLTLQEAWREAKSVCERQRSGCLHVKCQVCFSNWKRDGSIVQNKPPVWPPSYEGRPCPMCGTTLPRASGPL